MPGFTKPCSETPIRPCFLSLAHLERTLPRAELPEQTLDEHLAGQLSFCSPTCTKELSAGPLVPTSKGAFPMPEAPSSSSPEPQCSSTGDCGPLALPAIPTEQCSFPSTKSPGSWAKPQALPCEDQPPGVAFQAKPPGEGGAELAEHPVSSRLGEGREGRSGSPMGLGHMRPSGHRGALVKLELTQSGKAERTSRRRCLRSCLFQDSYSSPETERQGRQCKQSLGCAKLGGRSDGAGLWGTHCPYGGGDKESPGQGLWPQGSPREVTQWQCGRHKGEDTCHLLTADSDPAVQSAVPTGAPRSSHLLVPGPHLRQQGVVGALKKGMEQRIPEGRRTKRGEAELEWNPKS